MSGPLVDAHCHLDLPAFSSDRDAVWERARARQVTRAVIPAVRPDTWRATLDCALPRERVVSLGIHCIDQVKRRHRAWKHRVSG